MSRTAALSFAFRRKQSAQGFGDRAQLVRRAYGTLGFADAGITEKTVSKGDASYTVSRPEITAADSGSIGVTVRYTMTVPFRAFGRVVAEIPIPVEINAVLHEKY